MSQLHIRGLSWFKPIFCIASSPQDILEQMNERGSRFRYSSKKDLERSKLKRAAKTRALELASVTKALSYPRA
jgi:hypothetical protein